MLATDCGSELGQSQEGGEGGRRQPQPNRILSFCHRSGKIPRVEEGGVTEAVLSGLRSMLNWWVQNSIVYELGLLCHRGTNEFTSNACKK